MPVDLDLFCAVFLYGEVFKKPGPKPVDICLIIPGIVHAAAGAAPSLLFLFTRCRSASRSTAIIVIMTGLEITTA